MGGDRGRFLLLTPLCDGRSAPAAAAAAEDLIKRHETKHPPLKYIPVLLVAFFGAFLWFLLLDDRVSVLTDGHFLHHPE